MPPIKPHTPEWFEALENLNPYQAAMTRRVIALAGNDNACSICGDSEAKAFAVANVPPPASLRLCDDCHYCRALAGDRCTPLVDECFTALAA
jgi:hypothetical protein